MEKDVFKIEKNEKLIAVLRGKPRTIVNNYPDSNGNGNGNALVNQNIMQKPVVGDEVPRNGQVLTYNDDTRKKRWEATSSLELTRLKLSSVYHAFGGYENKSLTLTCDADVWTHITNGTSNLWTGLEGDGITMVADQIVITNAGDYFGSLSMTISGLNGKDFHIRVYNVTQSAVMGFPLGISTTGTGNEMLFSMPIYIEADAGDILQLQINSTDGTDPILDDAVFYISYLHE